MPDAGLVREPAAVVVRVVVERARGVRGLVARLDERAVQHALAADLGGRDAGAADLVAGPVLVHLAEAVAGEPVAAAAAATTAADIRARARAGSGIRGAATT